MLATELPDRETEPDRVTDPDRVTLPVFETDPDRETVPDFEALPVLEQFLDVLGQRYRVTWIHQEPFASMRDELARPTSVGCDRRQAKTHTFQVDDPKAFVRGRSGQYMAGCQTFR